MYTHTHKHTHSLPLYQYISANSKDRAKGGNRSKMTTIYTRVTLATSDGKEKLLPSESLTIVLTESPAEHQ
jgi:hypothetical protein